MGVVFEELGGGFVGFGADDGEGADGVADVGDAVGADLFGFAERAAHFDDGALVLVDPGVPGGDAGGFFGFAFGFGQGEPGGHGGAGFAAKEDGEVEVGAHGFSWVVGVWVLWVVRCCWVAGIMIFDCVGVGNGFAAFMCT